MNNTPLLNYQEASEVLRLSPLTLRAYVSQKKLPHYKLGNKVFFSPAELTAWIESRHVEARV